MNRRALLVAALLAGCSVQPGEHSAALFGDHADEGGSDECHGDGNGDDCPDASASDGGACTGPSCPTDSGASDGGDFDAGVPADAGSGSPTPVICDHLNAEVVPGAIAACAKPIAGGGFVRGLDDRWIWQPDGGWTPLSVGVSHFFVECGLAPDGCVPPLAPARIARIQAGDRAMCFAVPCPSGQVCRGGGFGCHAATAAERDGGHFADGKPDCDIQAPEDDFEPRPGCFEPDASGDWREVADGGRSQWTLACGRPQDGCPPGDPARWCRLVHCRRGESCVVPSEFGVCNEVDVP